MSKRNAPTLKRCCLPPGQLDYRNNKKTKQKKKKRFEWLRSESSAYCNRRAKVAKVETGYLYRYVLVSRVYLLANTASKSTISSSYFPSIIDNNDELVQLVWKSADVAAKCFISLQSEQSDHRSPASQRTPKVLRFFLFLFLLLILKPFSTAFSFFFFFFSLRFFSRVSSYIRQCSEYYAQKMYAGSHMPRSNDHATEKERKESACLPACLPERSDSNKMKTKRCWALTGIR